MKASLTMHKECLNLYLYAYCLPSISCLGAANTSQTKEKINTGGTKISVLEVGLQEQAKLPFMCPPLPRLIHKKIASNDYTTT